MFSQGHLWSYAYKDVQQSYLLLGFLVHLFGGKHDMKPHHGSPYKPYNMEVLHLELDLLNLKDLGVFDLEVPSFTNLYLACFEICCFGIPPWQLTCFAWHSFELHG